jgi:hypothetical protein
MIPNNHRMSSVEVKHCLTRMVLSKGADLLTLYWHMLMQISGSGGQTNPGVSSPSYRAHCREARAAAKESK